MSRASAPQRYAKKTLTATMNGLLTVTFVVIALAYSAQAGYLGGGYDGGLDGGYGGHGGFSEGYGGGHGDDGHDHYAHPKYNFNYAVHDPHTGDEKQHIEQRDGDEVKGSYTLKEADGTTRVVEYKADKHNGFNAVVHKIGTPHHDAGHSAGGFGGHGGYGGHY